MTVVISSGHGEHIRGASGYLDEVDEARRVVNRVAELMEDNGVTTYVFHDDVSTTQSENLDRIVDAHNAKSRDLDVSVHFNAYETTDKPMGTECLYVTQEELARKMSAAIAKATGLPDRGPKYRSDLKFLNGTEEPAILVETVFVDSRADADAYHESFDEVCEAIAEVLTGQDIDAPDDRPERPERPPIHHPPTEPPSEVLFSTKGRCSWFGGPEDEGVDEDEGLAFIYDYDDAPHLFLQEQPPGTSGLARRLNPQLFYVACRWDYDETSKDMLANPSRQAIVRAKGKQFLAWPADWGPHQDTGRVADLSPGLLEALDLTTDDEVEVVYPYE